MNYKSSWIFFIIFYSALTGYGQVHDLYIPVTINSPLFNKNNRKEIQFGICLNNYGGYLKFAGCFHKKFVTMSTELNDGFVSFDPLGFNKYSQITDSQLIETYPSLMIYGEFGIGYNFNLNSQKISLQCGFGYQFQNNRPRYFMQFDWGNESRKINTGISVRANYTQVSMQGLFVLEPVVQGKLKLWKFRVVNEYGYAIALKRHHNYMKPVLTLGIEYIM